MNFSTSPPKAWTDKGDAVEPGVEGRDDRRRGMAFGKGREAAQIGEQQRRLRWSRRRRAATGPPAPAPRCAGRDRPRAPPSRWRARSARRAAPLRSARPRRGGRLVGREGTRADPAEQRPVRPRPDRVFVHGPAARPASQRRPASPGWPAAPARQSAGANPSASITSPLVGPPQPSRAGRSADAARRASARRRRAAAPSSIRRRPSFARKTSAPGVSAAASTSQESVEESCMSRSWG